MKKMILFGTGISCILMALAFSQFFVSEEIFALSTVECISDKLLLTADGNETGGNGNETGGNGNETTDHNEEGGQRTRDGVETLPAGSITITVKDTIVIGPVVIDLGIGQEESLTIPPITEWLPRTFEWITDLPI